MPDVTPTRAAGLDRLTAFLPKAGWFYAARRNLYPHPAPLTPPAGDQIDRKARSLLLVTDEELSPEALLAAGLRPHTVAALSHVAGQSPLTVAGPVHQFVTGAVADALTRLGQPQAPVYGADGLDAMLDAATADGVERIVTLYTPVGPTATLLRRLEAEAAPRGITLDRILRDRDRDAWPHATHGFFRFREAVMG